MNAAKVIRAPHERRTTFSTHNLPLVIPISSSRKSASSSATGDPFNTITGDGVDMVDDTGHADPTQCHTSKGCSGTNLLTVPVTTHTPYRRSSWMVVDGGSVVQCVPVPV